MTKRGLVIFVGGTGSGKSTSLAAMIGYRNENRYGHIITIEDPVEYVHPHKNCLITQREVGVDTDSWEAALKNTLRQAPDVILIGEIRDRETMEHAIAFAETGHLCLGTLHANSSNQALDRIINFFPEERRQQLLMDLSLNLKAVISQRLIPLKDGKGRAAAVEILLNSPLISDLIFKGEVHEIKEIMKKSRELGMQTFDQALFDLYEAGRISYEDALRNADSINELRLKIKLHGKEVEGQGPHQGHRAPEHRLGPVRFTRKRTLRRPFLFAVAAFTAGAQPAYPNRAVRIVVAFSPGASPTSSPAPRRRSWPSSGASRWWSRTAPAPAARSAPWRWRARLPTATRCSCIRRATRSTPRSIQRCLTTRAGTSSRSRRSRASRWCWWSAPPARPAWPS